jgi:hypothetical protein
LRNEQFWNKAVHLSLTIFMKILNRENMKNLKMLQMGVPFVANHFTANEALQN